jgi:hypothetical protein
MVIAEEDEEQSELIIKSEFFRIRDGIGKAFIDIRHFGAWTRHEIGQFYKGSSFLLMQLLVNLHHLTDKDVENARRTMYKDRSTKTWMLKNPYELCSLANLRQVIYHKKNRPIELKQADQNYSMRANPDLENMYIEQYNHIVMFQEGEILRNQELALAKDIEIATNIIKQAFNRLGLKPMKFNYRRAHRESVRNILVNNAKLIKEHLYSPVSFREIREGTLELERIYLNYADLYPVNKSSLAVVGRGDCAIISIFYALRISVPVFLEGMLNVCNKEVVLDDNEQATIESLLYEGSCNGAVEMPAYFIVWVRSLIKKELESIQVDYIQLLDFYTNVKGSAGISAEERRNSDRYLQISDNIDIHENNFGTQNPLTYMGFIINAINSLNPHNTDKKPSMDILINSFEIAGSPSTTAVLLEDIHIMILFSRILPQFNICALCGVYSESSNSLKLKSIFTCTNLFQIRPVNIHPLFKFPPSLGKISRKDEFYINCRIAIKFYDNHDPSLCHYEALDPVIWDDFEDFEFEIDRNVQKQPPRKCKVKGAQLISRKVITKVSRKQLNEAKKF